MKEFEVNKDFLICIDSDGCAFDAMEIKHKECFIPNLIDVWGFQPISKYARETWEFVNLYSKWRGVNRFHALVKAFDLLGQRKAVAGRGFKVPDLEPLQKWLDTETAPGNPTLEVEIKKHDNDILKTSLKWSKAVNSTIKKIVHDVPPFPFVRESLQKIGQYADAVVVSSTPIEALEREWKEHNLLKYMKYVFGQEHGTKAQCIGIAISKGGYDKNRVLKIGDAMGDLEAAKINGVHFYPINSGNEESSWERFYVEAFSRFISGQYTEEYENSLIEEFIENLPETPNWKFK